MRPLSAISAPILARLYAERAQHFDNVEAELRRVIDAADEQNKRMAAGLCRQDNGKDRTMGALAEVLIVSDLTSLIEKKTGGAR